MSQIQQQLDAHQKPPDRMRSLFKKYHKCKEVDLCMDNDVLDISKDGAKMGKQLRPAPSPSLRDRYLAFSEFLFRLADGNGEDKAYVISSFEVTNIPGLYILPNFLSPEIQIALLDRLLHRDLSNPNHQTNVHLHHNISYPQESGIAESGSSPIPIHSFFSRSKAVTFTPKDPAVHKPITIADFLERKLRWMTLGGQYDWTAKQYPSEIPPPFPTDIKQLLGRLFPDMDAQAAIVNIYSPGDTLSIHRDVSEFCDRGLVSLSIGCDALFLVGNEDANETATIKLRSGDALYMTSASRYAWHGVPKIIPKTCPDWLAKWPAVNDNYAEYGHWQGWMANKRININVRQMTID